MNSVRSVEPATTRLDPDRELDADPSALAGREGRSRWSRGDLLRWA